MSICASIPSEGPGLLYAVRRTCGEKATCKDICTDPKLRKQGKFLAILHPAGFYMFKWTIETLEQGVKYVQS